MSNSIPGNQKHLTLHDRQYIEDSLDQGLSFREIAITSASSASVISSALLKSMTRYLGTLFLRIIAEPFSSTNLATLEKFWFASVMDTTRMYATYSSFAIHENNICLKIEWLRARRNC